MKCSRWLFLLLVISSCSHPATSHQSGNPIHAQDTIVLNEQLFSDIHKLIYENPLKARAKVFQILDSLDTNDLIIRIILFKHAGSSYVFETNYSEAIKYYNKALLIAEDIELYLEIANINNNLGVISNEIGNYKTAYIHFTEALNNYDLAKNQDKKVGTYNNIGLVYLYLKNYEKALTYFDKALDSTIQPKDTILIVSVLNNIALCYSSENKPDSALEYLGRAIRLSEQINNMYGLCISYQLMGNVYLTLNQTEKASEAYSVSIGLAQKKNWSYQLAISRIGIARVLLRLDRTSEALKIADDVFEMAEAQNSLVLKSDAHQVLSDIFGKAGDYQNSLKHYREYIKAQEEVINQTVIHQVYDVELTYLNQLNKMQELEIEKKELSLSKKNNLLFFMSLIFILLLIGLYLIYLNHRHRQKVRFQKTIIELTEKKSNAALEAEIQERKRIGQDLHDGLGQMLSVARLNVSALNQKSEVTNGRQLRLIESAIYSIDTAFNELRQISHNLSPTILVTKGLEEAVQDIVRRINESNKILISCEIFGLHRQLNNLIENTLYRAVQELTNNVIKHANATSISIQIVQNEEEITLMIEDNGLGFDLKKERPHSISSGIQNIQSRVENLHGTIFIDSKKNRGTIITITVPLNYVDYARTKN